MWEKLFEFANRHPWITMSIVATIMKGCKDTAYILKTGKDPESDFKFTFGPAEQTSQDKHGFE